MGLGLLLLPPSRFSYLATALHIGSSLPLSDSYGCRVFWIIAYWVEIVSQLVVKYVRFHNPKVNIRVINIRAVGRIDNPGGII